MTKTDEVVIEAVEKFSMYSNEIEKILFESLEQSKRQISKSKISKMLNGETSDALKEIVPLEIRRSAGLFFTSTKLAFQVADFIAPILKKGFKIADPACGAGNLLIACAKYLPKCETFKETMEQWSNIILGYDLHPEFIRATKLRLSLLASSLHPEDKYNTSQFYSNKFFKDIKIGNVFDNNSFSRDTIITVNPPYGYMNAPEHCEWGSGKIQIAGWFIESLLKNSPDGQHIVAILPDVLRSGSRYLRWRKLLESYCSSGEIKLIGRFDKYTDVDVFIFHGIAGKNIGHKINWKTEESVDNSKLSDFFDVHVGTIVPHRDKIEGEFYPYLHARSAKPWETLLCIPEKKQSLKKVFKSPFVVVHRTSSPTDKHRCIATVIDVKKEVAVENHLIVLRPKKGGVGNCKKLLKLLKAQETNDYMNKRIRCRHLTVSSIKSIPVADNYF